jgi:nuclear pore complex protein Nup107
VSELDPDAPTRQRRRIDPDNARDEERLMTAVWRLLRAGRPVDARALCEAVGQPWRAAAMGDGGEAGLLLWIVG